MVEVAYPRCGICQLRRGEKLLNDSTISELRSGIAYRTRRGWCLVSGSQADGLAMEQSWGHPPADMDYMGLLGFRLGVHVAEGHRPREDACFRYHSQGCPPAYCRLEVTDVDRFRDYMILRYMQEDTSSSKEQRRKVQRCIHREAGRNWLNIYRTIRTMVLKEGEVISGPAGQRGIDDWVRAFVCSAPHPDMERLFRQKSRGAWPPAELIEDVLQIPMLLVMVGNKTSHDFELQARLSWSICEMKFTQALPEGVRQGYIACKYVLKRFLAVHRDQNKAGDGRSHVGSYHLKMVFLNFLEKNPPPTITSPFRLYVDLLHELDRFIKSGQLPHYFLAQCNLLDTVVEEERHIARRAIEDILSDPTAALLTSPTEPQQVYGEVRPDDLVNSFHRASVHPTCRQSRKDLSNLLARLDVCRRELYHTQRQSDGPAVPGRSELTVLVDSLEHLWYIDVLLQVCGNTRALAMELPQSCTTPSIWYNTGCPLSTFCLDNPLIMMLLLQHCPGLWLVAWRYPVIVWTFIDVKLRNSQPGITLHILGFWDRTCPMIGLIGHMTY